jgi:hypothetical protein
MATKPDNTAEEQGGAKSLAVELIRQPSGSEIATGKNYEPGFRADGTAYPGVDPDTGERKAVTWAGLREEFGEREGARLYNDLAVAAFGGPQPGKPSLSYVTVNNFRARHQDRFGNFTESEVDYEKAREKFIARRERAKKIMADAEAAKAKGV